ncbi:substrate-binding domain-containing protein, partial [Streptomyces sp. NPDC002588]|uniref:substrate-binding domain-containing protein n=1 Tax=Streptomyces sp. NPDC002588 TaxID=3154419 RepID=UPI003326A9E6
FAYVTPPLTTVRQPFDAAAGEGIRLLVHAIEQPEKDLPPASEPPLELVVRGSTAPPPPHQGQALPPT